MKYPHVMSERETLALAISGVSLARFGDGELKICTGGNAVSQDYSDRLSAELCSILSAPLRNVLACVPNVQSATPRSKFWSEYSAPRYTGLYNHQTVYGSSFITRPDNAPWIDCPDYWQEVTRIWRGRSVAYVGGQMSLAHVVQETAAHVSVIQVPRKNAYAQIDSLTAHLLSRPYAAIIIAMGAAGTALAARLGRDGAQHALDLGHIGMFMQNPGAFSTDPDQLATPAYRELLRHAHATTNWGRGGGGWVLPVVDMYRKLEAVDVLDYGCGGGMLKPALKELGIKCLEYDPGVIGKDILPKLADLVVSTDVFEHIEPDNVANVLKHTFALARKGAFFVIAKQPAKKILKDGRNAHLVCRETGWWVDRLVEAGWQRDRIKIKEDAWKKCVLELRK